MKIPFDYQEHLNSYSKKNKNGYKILPRIARTGLIGAGEIADLPSHLSSLLHGKSLEKEKSMAHAIEHTFDKYTKGKYIPKTQTEKIADAVGRFAIGGKGVGAGLKAVGKAPRLAKFINPTVPGMAGVGVGQHILNKNPEDMTNSMAANFLTTLATKKAGNLGKTLIKNPENILNPISTYKTKSMIRKNPTFQKSLEHHLNTKAGSEIINEVPADKMGLNIYSSAKTYKQNMQNEFSKDYSNLEHKLKHKLGSNPEKNIQVSAKSSAQTLRKSYFNMENETQKDVFLKSPAGKMWLRLLGAPANTKSIEVDQMLRHGSNKVKNPRLNLAEAKEAESSIQDLVKTGLGEIGPNAQRILKKAGSQLRSETSEAISKVDPLIGKEWSSVNKRFSKWQKNDVPFLNEINDLAGQPEKITGLVLSDLNKGAKPLSNALRMSSESKKNNIALGALHDLGHVKNQFDMSNFIKNFEGLSIKEQKRVLSGLSPSIRMPFEKALSEARNYADIKRTPSRLDKLREMFLSPTKNKAISAFSSSTKPPTQNQLDKAFKLISKHEIPSAGAISTPKERFIGKNIAQQNLLTHPGEYEEFPQEEVSPEERYNLLKSMSDEELNSYETPQFASRPIQDLTDEELNAM